jgi:hypothetical protein
MGSDLTVVFEGNKITVVRPGTELWVSYDKHPHSLHLILTDTWRNWTRMTPEVSQFRVEAFRAAVAKARDLGWIPRRRR